MSDGKIKHAQKSEGFFREVWRLTMCGNSVEQIAAHLGTSAPTVRRTQTRMRQSSAPSPGPDTNVFTPLFEAAREKRIPNFLSWDRYMATLRQFYFGNQDVSFEAKHQCMTQCPVRLSPRKFADKFIGYHHVEGTRYIISLLEFVNAKALAIERKKYLKCRSCPLKAYKQAVFADYEGDSYLFLYLMFYLSRFRFRDADPKDIILVYAEAAVFGMIQELVVKTLQDTALAGGSDEDALIAAEAYFVEITDKTFDAIRSGI